MSIFQIVLNVPFFSDQDNYMTAAGLVYCLPLIEWMVLNYEADLDTKDKVALLVLNIIKVHMKMRARMADSPYHPRYLPREQLLKLLINIISK